jgi:hypothetical protein
MSKGSPSFSSSQGWSQKLCSAARSGINLTCHRRAFCNMEFMLDTTMDVKAAKLILK